MSETFKKGDVVTFYRYGGEAEGPPIRCIIESVMPTRDGLAIVFSDVGETMGILRDATAPRLSASAMIGEPAE